MGRSLEVVSGSPKFHHSNLSVRCVDSCESSLRPRKKGRWRGQMYQNHFITDMKVFGFLIRLVRCFSVLRYSKCHLCTILSWKAYSCCQCFKRLLGTANSSGSGIDVRGAPIRKCPGVNAVRSFLNESIVGSLTLLQFELSK